MRWPTAHRRRYRPRRGYAGRRFRRAAHAHRPDARVLGHRGRGAALGYESSSPLLAICVHTQIIEEWVGIAPPDRRTGGLELAQQGGRAHVIPDGELHADGVAMTIGTNG